MKTRSCWLLVLALGSAPAHADETASPRLELVGPAATAATAAAAQDLGEPGAVPDHRSPECPGCPERHPTRAIVEAIVAHRPDRGGQAMVRHIRQFAYLVHDFERFAEHQSGPGTHQGRGR